MTKDAVGTNLKIYLKWNDYQICHFFVISYFLMYNENSILSMKLNLHFLKNEFGNSYVLISTKLMLKLEI